MQKYVMKKLLIMLLAVVCILIPSALAEEDAPFDLQEHMVMSGMDKSWYQGYEPMVEGDSLTIHLPLKSERSNGKVTVTLVLDDPEISPIKSEKLTAVFWRSEGLFSAKLSLKLSPSRVNGDYSGKVVLEGDDKDGRDIKMEIPVVIRIRSTTSILTVESSVVLPLKTEISFALPKKMDSQALA